MPTRLHIVVVAVVVRGGGGGGCSSVFLSFSSKAEWTRR
jgi:hypothetical protein